VIGLFVGRNVKFLGDMIRYNLVSSIEDILKSLTALKYRVDFILLHKEIKISRDSPVGIATGYGLDDRGVGVRVPVGSRIFSMSSRPALGPTEPPIQWLTGVKRPGREADHTSN
jgi:hypothetical protein